MKRQQRARSRQSSEESTLPETTPVLSDLESLGPFCEALRDRLAMYFEQAGYRHKPKLVGVSGCGSGSGVSTLATGLAAALSKVGEGRVLLVTASAHNGRGYPLVSSAPALSLTEVLEQDKRSMALVQQNLYLVSTEDGNGGSSSVPLRKYFDLIPKMKASDYDYVVFDLPPVSQTSITFRLAGMLDKLLLVVQSEKDHRDMIGRAKALLADSKADVGAVLNKNRKYIPNWLVQELR